METIARIAARNGDARGTRPALIVCLGDSVTHGCFEVFINRHGQVDTRYDPDEAYPAQLARKLHRYYPIAAACVLNAGISGDNAAGGLLRLERDALSRAPELVVVNFGLNDAMNPDVEGGLAAYARDMRAIFRQILDAGAQALLLTPNAMCEYVAHGMEARLRDIAGQAARVMAEGTLARYVQAARDAARELRVPVADAWARWERLRARGVDTTALLSNHINHPTPDMHGVFVEEIMGRIMES